jgi:hypothetical protein
MVGRGDGVNDVQEPEEKAAEPDLSDNLRNGHSSSDLLLAAAQPQVGLIERFSNQAAAQPERGPAADMLKGFGVAGDADDKAERPVNSGSPADKRLAESRQPAGPLTDALNGFYDKKSDASGLSDLLTKSQMSPDQLRNRYSREPKAGYPPVESDGTSLNIYDRQNKQYNFSYDANSGTYKLDSTRARGDDGYRAPERLRNTDADAFATAVVASLKRPNRPVADISTEVSRYVQLSLDRKVPLNELAESINRQLASDKAGHSVAWVQGSEMKLRAKGVPDFSIKVNNGRSSAHVGP